MSKKHREKILGFVKRHPDGFGFLIPQDIDHPDVYIPRKYMYGVMSNDKVEALVRPEPRGDRYRGKVTQIVERAFTKVTGRLYRLAETSAILLDSSHAWGEDLRVELENEREGAHA